MRSVEPMPTLAGRLSVLAFLSIAASLAPTGSAVADAGSFLRSIAGDWRGRGEASIPGRESAEKISCRVSNTYDEARSELVVTGQCATTQAKNAVNGRIQHNGNSVSGAFLSAFDGATVTKSNGSLQGQTLVVSTNFVDNATGNLTRSRQVIRKEGSGFSAEFYLFSNKNGAFERAGSISFSGG